MKKLMDRLLKLDRRWTFLAIGISAVLPFLFPIGLAIHPSKEVQQVFDHVQALKGTGKPLVISFDFDPGTDAEVGPMAIALMDHAFLNNVPVLGLNFIYTGTSLAEIHIKKAAEKHGKEYGIDYVFLGFKTAFPNVMINMSKDIRLSFNADYYNKPIGDLPMMRKIKNYDDFGFTIGLGGTRMVEYWIIYGVGPYDFDYAIGCTAVMASDYYPYIQTGQSKGIIGGMKGAAEYEQLLLDAGLTETLGDAAMGLDSQSLCHLVVIGFIVLGNIAYFGEQRRKRKARQ